MRNYLLERHTISKRYIKNNVFHDVHILYKHSFCSRLSFCFLQDLTMVCDLFLWDTYNTKYHFPNLKITAVDMLQQVYAKFDCWLYTYRCVVHVPCNCASIIMVVTRHTEHMNIFCEPCNKNLAQLFKPSYNSTLNYFVIELYNKQYFLKSDESF